MAPCRLAEQSAPLQNPLNTSPLRLLDQQLDRILARVAQPNVVLRVAALSICLLELAALYGPPGGPGASPFSAPPQALLASSAVFSAIALWPPKPSRWHHVAASCDVARSITITVAATSWARPENVRLGSRAS